ncbi:MAG: redoxin domain-containing protein [Pirellulales bacterium]|nr:redoxin domain-containing protein [Pirellulales bacterium]
MRPLSRSASTLGTRTAGAALATLAVVSAALAASSDGQPKPMPASGPKPVTATDAATAADINADVDRSGVGIRIRSFTLRDQRNTAVSLQKHAEGRIAVVAFVGTECPLVALYGPRLAELAAEYEAKGIAFLGIDSNEQDTRAEVFAWSQKAGIEFPVVKDVDCKVADHFGAKRTPEVFVLDRERVVRYRGRIDDQYGIQRGAPYKRNEPKRRDLALALDELLAEKPVSVAQTDPPGCLIGRASLDPGSPQDEGEGSSPHGGRITFAHDVAPIFNKHCVQCHRAGEIGPMPLAKFEDTKGWGDMIREVVSERRMPPWHADPKYGTFGNDARLSDEEIQTITTWVDGGCPKGNARELPKAPKFAAGWQIDKPDLILPMSSQPFPVQAEGTMDYQYFTVDPGFTEDMWISAAEARPGNRAVVHHIIVFVERPDGRKSAIPIDGFLVATAPGARPLVLPEGYAKKVPAGSKLKFQMHYTPNGTAQSDLSSVGLKFANPRNVRTLVRTDAAFNIVFRIPPRAEAYPVNSMRTMGKDVLLVSLYPHMHLRGSAFRYTARYPDGKEEILLDIPAYDFNWQNTYELKEPKLLPKGTVLRCDAKFNNSSSNAANPNPNQEVIFGEQTYQEMMIGFYDVALPRDDADSAGGLAESPKKGRRAADRKPARPRGRTTSDRG